MRGNGPFSLSMLSGQSVSSEDKFKYRLCAKSVATGNRMIVLSFLSWLMLIAGSGLFIR